MGLHNGYAGPGQRDAVKDGPSSAKHKSLLPSKIPFRSTASSAGTPPGSGRFCPGCAVTRSKEDPEGSASSSIPWKAIGITVGAAVTVGAAAVVAAPVALSAAGFGAAGVSAGSMAAGIQSTMGGVIVKGGLFSLCQSWGAAGLTATAQSACAMAGGSVGAAVGVVISKMKGQAKNSSQDAEKKPEEKPREEPDGAVEEEPEEKSKEEAAGELDGEAEKQEQRKVVLHLCPGCGAKFFCEGKQF